MRDLVNSLNTPRILVISNNSFSNTKNNGKTLASFFKEFPSENIAQLYFNNEIPTDNYYKKFFRITDLELIKSFFSNSTPGTSINLQESEKVESNKRRKNNFKRKLNKYNIVRIGRELLWLTKRWNTIDLNNWLEKFSPEIVFFCAGDSGFAYDITDYIQKKFDTKLIVFITDDYILPRQTYSPFWWIRRNYILNKMKKIIDKCDLFITISENMKKVYKDIFGKDSIVAMNMTDSMLCEDIQKTDNNVITLLYAGGLHYRRYETLRLLAQSLDKYNKSKKGKKAILKIYSNSEPSKKIKNYLNIPGTSMYCGSLNPVELKIELNKCDIPVHVESFDNKCIEATRLSISTKIPEYLSLGKPILAIGPEEIASMNYLEDCAWCITKLSSLDIKLKQLLEDEIVKQELSCKAIKKYNKNHNKNFIPDIFTEKIKKL